MGAELITCLQAKKHGQNLDFDAGRTLLGELTLEDFSPYFLDTFINEDEIDVDDLDFPTDEAWEAAVEDERLRLARERLSAAIDEVEEMHDNTPRNMEFWTDVFGGFDIFIVGESTWGDTPEGYQSAIAVYEVDRVRKAINFVDIKTGEV